MPTVYIAGPMRGLPDSNFASFDRAKIILESQGWTVLSPADIDRQNGDSGKVGEQVGKAGGTPAWIREFARRDLDILVNTLAAERGDAIAVLPGCKAPSACLAEIAVGQWVKLNFISAISGRSLAPDDPQGQVDREFSTLGWANAIPVYGSQPISCGCDDVSCPSMYDLNQQMQALANAPQYDRED